MSRVETIYGPVEGVTAENGVEGFYGIPFAAPPTGDLRFKSPRPPQPWTEVRAADSFGPWSLQPPPGVGSVIGGEESGMSEDCLTLNIWTPAATKDDGKKRPVMVWIHGGAFQTGSGGGLLYRGHNLAKRGDAVVVTINYRLGALGFATHPDLADPDTGATGNWGILDQIASLEWVRDNIAAFGGDPSNVTIFGESAGSMSVSVLLGTPKAKGLFHKAIAESGGPYAVPTQSAHQMTEDLAKELNTTVAGLKEVPADQFVDATQRLLAKRGPAGGGIGFAPSLDGTLLQKNPATTIAEGLNADVPVIAGTNLDEMRLFSIGDRKAFDLDEDGLRRRLDRALAARGTSVDIEKAIDTYRNARQARGDDASPTALWFAIMSDVVFRSSAMEMLARQSTHEPRTYAYLFTWASPAMGGLLGACHALEIPFVFGALELPIMSTFVGTGPEADHLSDQMQDAWLAFAHTGDPSTPSLGRWPAYDPATKSTMILGKDSHTEDAPYDEELRFWQT
jgi:para-nitrobenzyl esterase